MAANFFLSLLSHKTVRATRGLAPNSEDGVMKPEQRFGTEQNGLIETPTLRGFLQSKITTKG